MSQCCEKLTLLDTTFYCVLPKEHQCKHEYKFLQSDVERFVRRAERAEKDLAAARSRISYLEPIFIAARELVDNAEEYECEGLGLWAQHGWWEPLHDALDPDGSAAADDMRQPVTPAKKEDGNEIA